MIPSLINIDEYVYLVPLVFVNISFISVRMYGGFSYFIHNKTIYITYITLGSLLAYLLLSVLLVKVGIIGVAISAAFVSVISCSFYYYLAHKIESFNLMKQCKLGESNSISFTLKSTFNIFLHIQDNLCVCVTVLLQQKNNRSYLISLKVGKSSLS